MPSVKQSLDSLSPRVKELEAVIERQAAVIERMRLAKFAIPASRAKKSGQSFVRVIIPDTHGAHLDKAAAAAFLSDLKILKPAEVVRLGDHIDCGGFLAQHHTLGFVPETAYTFEEDVAAANVFLDETQQRTGKVRDWYILGNHEQRVEKWIIKQTLRNPGDSAYLYRLFGPESALSLAKRGIQVVRRDKTYHGLDKRGTIKLGKCLFMHGTRCGIYAAKQTLEDVGTNVVSGHTHRISSFVKETAHGVIGSWQFGCLCEKHPLYGDTNVSNWAHGYGVQIVHKDGTFVTITIPILDGQSYLRGLIR